MWFSFGYSPSSTMDIIKDTNQLAENTHMKYCDYMNVNFKDIFLFISNIFGQHNFIFKSFPLLSLLLNGPVQHYL